MVTAAILWFLQSVFVYDIMRAMTKDPNYHNITKNTFPFQSYVLLLQTVVTQLEEHSYICML